MSDGQRVVGGKVVAGLYGKALAKWMTPEAREQLKAAGIDSDAWADSYAYEVWVDGLKRVSASLFPEQVPQAALRSLGARVIEGVRALGVVKSAFLTMAKFAGPKRLIRQLNGQHIKGVDFLRIQVNEKGPKTMEVELNDVECLPLVAGATEAALEALGVREGRVDASTRDGLGVMWITWG
jgi:uncharacterized protein (TIGR02265 family)